MTAGGVLRLAWRQARGGVRHLAAVFACVALGVGALVAVGSLAHGLEAALAGGGSATIGDLFTNAKVPEPLRPLWCVLADANDNALWLPGLADGAAMRIEGEPRWLVRLRIN